MGELERDGLDWVTVGYGNVEPPASTYPDLGRPWELFRAALRGAREGDRSLLAPLLQVLRQSIEQDGDPRLANACAELIGDAGSDELVDRLADLLDTDLRIDWAIICCTAPYNRSRLSDAAILFRAYVRHAAHPDADIIAVWLSDMLERPGIEKGLLDHLLYTESAIYGPMVTERLAALEQEIGADRVIVHAGERFDVKVLARHMLSEVCTSHFRRELRHRFEAVTGIDCSSFYRNGELHPLAAAAILEEFLESPAAQRFEPGRRYFFGQLIEP